MGLFWLCCYAVCDEMTSPVPLDGMSAADVVFGSELFCVVFFHRLSWFGFGIELCQFLRIFLFTFDQNQRTYTDEKIKKTFCIAR